MRDICDLAKALFLVVILLGGVVVGRGQEASEQKTREQVREEEKLRDRERIRENESKILEKYSERFGVDVETLLDLRTKRFGYGEICHALVLSEMANKPLEEIVGMRDSGEGWGEIAEECGVKLGEVRRSVRRERRRITQELTRQERRTFRRCWQGRPEPEEGLKGERPGYGKEKPARDLSEPGPGRGKGGGKAAGK